MRYFHPPNDDFEAAVQNIKARLTESIIETEVRTMERPHVVVCEAMGSEFISYVGPFSSGFAALARAEQEAGQLTPKDRIRYSVAPLFDPEGDEASDAHSTAGDQP